MRYAMVDRKELDITENNVELMKEASKSATIRYFRSFAARGFFLDELTQLVANANARAHATYRTAATCPHRLKLRRLPIPLRDRSRLFRFLLPPYVPADLEKRPLFHIG